MQILADDGASLDLKDDEGFGLGFRVEGLQTLERIQQ